MSSKKIIFIIFILFFTHANSYGEIDTINSFPPEEKRDCWACHRLPNMNTNEGTIASQELCFECHANQDCQRKIGEHSLSLQVNPEDFAKTMHKHNACIQCHFDVAKSPHKSEEGVQCLGCHTIHGEGEIHDPHIRVRCEACHRSSQAVVMDSESGQIRLAHFTEDKKPIYLGGHEFTDITNNEFCAGKCHQPQNKVGAPEMVLPSKSILCIICHSAPFKIGHPLFWISAIIFALGVFFTVFIWFGGSVKGEKKSFHKKIALGSEEIWSTIFSRKIFSISKIIIYDTIFQRRILKESVRRWSVHTLIYLGFFARFFLGLATLLIFKLNPDSQLSGALIDKNHGFTAFIYDFLGLLIVLGIVWAVIQRLIVKPEHVVSEGQDKIALGIIGILIILGFVLEGTRIAITQIPLEMATYSFIGYPIAKLLSLFPLNWQYIYGFLWYAHAGAGALFIAYLPFSKMKHIIITPLVLALNYDLKE